jgi:hypothetical protein
VRLEWDTRDLQPKIMSSDNGIELGLSRAEALQQPSHSALFGLWRDRQEDSVELQQALRAEWSGR